MKPREIFTVSDRAYYPQEENGVDEKCLLEKLGVVSCLKGTEKKNKSLLCVTRVQRPQTVRSVSKHQAFVKQQ